MIRNMLMHCAFAVISYEAKGEPACCQLLEGTLQALPDMLVRQL